MPPALISFLQRWAIITLGVVIAASIVRGIDYENAGDLLIASLILGILNAFARPIMMLLSLPLVVFSLGLFIWIINAALLYFVGYLVEDFQVSSFGASLLGALIISLISLIANVLLGTSRGKIEVRRYSTRSQREKKEKDDDDQGPIIDV